VNGAVIWLTVLLGFGVLVARRRTVGIALVTAQSLLLATSALTSGDSLPDRLAAAGSLTVRALLFAGLLFLMVHRTREQRPVRAPAGPAGRGAAAICFALLLATMIPTLGLESDDAQRGVVSLLAFGVVTVATRRSTLLQLLGLVVVENAVAMAALTAPVQLPTLIELGVAADLIVLVVVAALLHHRIYLAFGTGDVSRLESLRD
jgi:hydrogenase-4 component E